MNVTNSIVDFFQGNPFNNYIGSLIEKATDTRNQAENWTLFMEICDVINSTEDGPKIAMRAFRRRINSEVNKSNAVVLYSLVLLETCVKNCGYRFHLVVCSRDLMQDFEKLILVGNGVLVNDKHDIPVIVKDKILSLIQGWYDSFKGQPDLKEIQFTYHRLLEAGVQFPMRDLGSMSPIVTPSPLSTQAASIPGPDAATLAINTPTLHSTSQDQALSTSDKVQVVPPQSEPPVNFEKLSQRFGKELVSVQGNIDVLGEIMQEYPSTDVVPDDAVGLIKNLSIVCTEMQCRVVQLINRWDEAGAAAAESPVLMEALRVNDELNSVLTQYERYERAISSCVTQQQDLESQSVDLHAALDPATAGMATVGEPTGMATDPDLASKIKRSHITDMYAAQQDIGDFYDGFSKATGAAASPQKNTTKSSGNALSSQEFDQFLNERSSDNGKPAMKSNAGDGLPESLSGDRIESNHNNQGSVEKQLFDL